MEIDCERASFFCHPTGGMGRGDLPGAFADVVRAETLHRDYSVGYVEVVSAAADYEDGADPVLRMQPAHAVDIRRNRLLRFGNKRLHARVSDQEVGGGGIFIDEQTVSARFERLNNRRSLAGGATGVGAGEAARRLSQGKIADKRGDVNPADRTPVLCSNFDQISRADDKLAPIVGSVIINAPLDGPQQRRLSHDSRHRR